MNLRAKLCSVQFLIVFVLSRDLTWRDVQHIIARTARPGPVRISQNEWTVNKANLSGEKLAKYTWQYVHYKKPQSIGLSTISFGQ